MNGKTSKSNAEKAYKRIEGAKRFGKSASYYQVQHQWNHAAAKQAIVQSTIGAPCFAIVFTKQPDAATANRIEKQGIQAFSAASAARLARLLEHADVRRTTQSVRAWHGLRRRSARCAKWLLERCP